MLCVESDKRDIVPLFDVMVFIKNRHIKSLEHIIFARNTLFINSVVEIVIQISVYIKLIFIVFIIILVISKPEAGTELKSEGASVSADVSVEGADAPEDEAACIF